MLDALELLLRRLVDELQEVDGFFSFETLFNKIISSSISPLLSCLVFSLLFSFVLSCLPFSFVLSCLLLSLLAFSLLPLSLSSFSVSLCLCLRVMLRVVLLCDVVCESACGVGGVCRCGCGCGCGTLKTPVCPFKTLPCVHSQRPPCVRAQRAHAETHARVVPVHTATF